MEEAPCPACGRGLIRRMQGGTGVGDDLGRVHIQRGRHGYCDSCGAAYEPDEQGLWQPAGEDS